LFWTGSSSTAWEKGRITFLRVLGDQRTRVAVQAKKIDDLLCSLGIEHDVGVWRDGRLHSWFRGARALLMMLCGLELTTAALAYNLLLEMN
jgi:hypothetical protein